MFSFLFTNLKCEASPSLVNEFMNKEAPNCCLVWMLVEQGEMEPALKEMSQIWKYKCSTPFRVWKEEAYWRNYSDTEEMIHYMLAMFWINYKLGNIAEMQSKSDQLDQLIHWEFGQNDKAVP